MIWNYLLLGMSWFQKCEITFVYQNRWEFLLIINGMKENKVYVWCERKFIIKWFNKTLKNIVSKNVSGN